MQARLLVVNRDRSNRLYSIIGEGETMKETCRLCLRVQAPARLTSIFGEEESSKRLRSRILDSCPITLFEDDRLPNAICDQCRRKLTITYEFREQCKRTENVLRSRYRSSYREQSTCFADESVVQNVEEHSKDDEETKAKGEIVDESIDARKNAESRGEKRSVVRAESSIDGEKLNGADKRYLCDVCSKTFLSKSGLRFHLKSHYGAKPHQCRHCDKRFAIPSYAKRHEKIHAAEKRFVCHVCSASFASSNGLKYHLRSHTGEANYRCEVCGKSFNRPKYLREHAYTHTGEKPFACKTCGACYGNSGSLYVHEKRCKIRAMDGE